MGLLSALSAPLIRRKEKPEPYGLASIDQNLEEKQGGFLMILVQSYDEQSHCSLQILKQIGYSGMERFRSLDAIARECPWELCWLIVGISGFLSSGVCGIGVE